jgi:hypothetical protein
VDEALALWVPTGADLDWYLEFKKELTDALNGIKER